MKLKAWLLAVALQADVGTVLQYQVVQNCRR